MFVGTLVLDLLLGDVASLKAKRAVVRPVVAELQRRFAVAVSEVGDPDLYRRAVIGVATVSGEAGHARTVLEACERLVVGHPELELLSARHRLFSADDE